jgi:hypothetical protein
LVLALSVWVGFNGVVFGQRNLSFVTANNYALEHLIWHVPEFSVLWKPFIDGFNLNFLNKIRFVFVVSAFIWLARVHLIHLLKRSLNSKVLL